MVTDFHCQSAPTSTLTSPEMTSTLMMMMMMSLVSTLAVLELARLVVVWRIDAHFGPTKRVSQETHSPRIVFSRRELQVLDSDWLTQLITNL